MDGLAGLWMIFGQAIAAQLRGWLAHRMQVRWWLPRLAIVLTLALALWLTYSHLPTWRPAPLHFSMAIDIDLFES